MGIPCHYNGCPHSPPGILDEGHPTILLLKFEGFRELSIFSPSEVGRDDRMVTRDEDGKVRPAGIYPVDGHKIHSPFTVKDGKSTNRKLVKSTYLGNGREVNKSTKAGERHHSAPSEYKLGIG